MSNRELSGAINMDEEKKNFLHFVYLLNCVTPHVLERFVNRNYPGGIYRAMQDNRDTLRDLLPTECWKEMEIFIGKILLCFTKSTIISFC